MKARTKDITKIKLKVDHDGRMFFDPKQGWVTNVHWLVKSDCVVLSDKTLQLIIEAGIPFIKTGRKIQVGDSCVDMPDFSRVIPANNTHRIRETGFTYHNTLLLNVEGQESPAAINPMYAGVLSLGTAWGGKSKDPIVVKGGKDGEEIRAILMPMLMEAHFPEWGKI